MGGDLFFMEDQAKSRVDNATPQPNTSHLTEEQKRAMELQDEIEHSHGETRERKAEDAERLGQ